MMTSRTKTPLDLRSAFTLVELLLVLALVVVLAAIAAPLMTGALAKARLDAAAEELVSAWNEARLEAIRTGEPIAFRCQIETPTYQVGSLSAAMQGEVSGVNKHDDLSSVIFKQLSLGEHDDDPPPDPTVVAVLVFQPDGVTSDAFAIIQAEGGARRRVSLRGLTGTATIKAISSEPRLAGSF